MYVAILVPYRAKLSADTMSNSWIAFFYELQENIYLQLHNTVYISKNLCEGIMYSYVYKKWKKNICPNKVKSMYEQ